MSVASVRTMLVTSARQGYAVGAFNVTNVLQMKAVLDAAVEKKMPVLIQTSVSPSRLLGPEAWAAAFRAMAEKLPIPAGLQLDHCTDVAYCRTCIDAGYTSIMIDASKLVFDENVRQTREVCDYAHRHGGVSVEGELGTVSGVEDQVKVAEDEAALCVPEQAVEFVRRTGVDALAPAIGTAHGIYLSKNPRIDSARLARINELINGGGVVVPLVIHGGTGLPEDTVRTLVARGGAKLNVSTELKHALIDAEFEYLSAHRSEYDPGKLDKFVMAAITSKIFSWVDLLGCVGKA
jgi:tagatose 1,6-diphosphate aldolase GatY/KbaY